MNFPVPLRKVHLWIPNIFEFKGGIQVYSAFLLQALQEIQVFKSCDVFLKHDRAAPDTLIETSNLRFHCLGKWPSSLRTGAFATAIAAAALQQKPNLILSTHLNFTPVAYWLKKIAGVPYWTIAHGVDAWNITNPQLITSLAHADRILAVSHYTRDRLLQEQKLNPDKVSLLPNTFNSSQFQVTPKPQKLLERYQLQANQPVILTVARLDSSERYKGYDQILKALPKIRQGIPNIHYIIVGKGSDRIRVEHLISSLNLQDCVTLAGFIPDEELGEHYNLCDVFAMPSKGEGFGIVYLEALACGKPVLGGNQDGAIDALCNGELGVLVDPDNIDQIAQALIQILEGIYSHPLLYQPALLRQKVIETYGFDQFKRKSTTLLKTLDSRG